MDSFGSEMASAIQGWVSETARTNTNGEIIWSVVTFDGNIEYPVRSRRLTKSTQFRGEWIIPRGATALRDGILSAIEVADAEVKTAVRKNQSHSVEVVVFTDGEENSSQNISQYELNRLIKDRKAKGWTVTFLAANQDAISSGVSYGFDVGRSMTSSIGFQKNAWAAVARSKRKSFKKKTRKKCVSKRDAKSYGVY